MRRGLPYSLAVHLVILVVTVVFGAHVPAPNLRPQNVIQVRMIEKQKPQPAAPEPEPEIAQPEEPPPEPERVPEKSPDKPAVKPEPEKPKPEPKQPADRKQEAPPQDEVKNRPSADDDQPVLSGTDEPFPFAWYLDIVKGRITRNWSPHQLGIRQGSELTCAVHFVIERTGAVTRATLAQSSGIALLDREGLRAVQAAHPLPPLPHAFASRSLGVTFVFHLRSGL